MGIAISILLGSRANLPRSKVKISDDCWLEVLKFLTCSKWSEKLFVSRQIKRIAERNISRLPRATIEFAVLGGESPKRKQMRAMSCNINNAIIGFGAIVPQSETEQWYVNRGITLEARVQFRPLSTRMPPGSILLEKAFFDGHDTDLTDMCILGPVQKDGEVKKSLIEHLFRAQDLYKSIIFHAQFCPSRKFSWAAMEQFLTVIFSPLSYVKRIEMYAVNQKFIDSVKEKFADFDNQGNTMHFKKCTNNKPLYIHCESFSLLHRTGMSFHELRDLLKWLERNVRSDSIRMPPVGVYTHYEDRAAVCHLLHNFMFGALRICAKRELILHSKTETNLIISLVKKFRTLPRFECEIPTIVIKAFSLTDLEDIQPNLGPNVIRQEVDSQGAKFLYVFENGMNRMRISFCKKCNNRLVKYDCYVKFYAIQLFV